MSKNDIVGDLGHNMAVGDPFSDERGSAARANGGKVPMGYIPVHTWMSLWKSDATFAGVNSSKWALFEVLERVGNWEKGLSSINTALVACPFSWFEEACWVFKYGAEKYAPNQWMKGMDWSIPKECILRHAKAIFEDGESHDDESGRHHFGHIVCNLVMLAHYQQFYKEGDDRPDPEVFNVSGD